MAIVRPHGRAPRGKALGFGGGPSQATYLPAIKRLEAAAGSGAWGQARDLRDGSLIQIEPGCDLGQVSGRFHASVPASAAGDGGGTPYRPVGTEGAGTSEAVGAWPPGSTTDISAKST